MPMDVVQRRVQGFMFKQPVAQRIAKRRLCGRDCSIADRQVFRTKVCMAWPENKKNQGWSIKEFGVATLDQ